MKRLFQVKGQSSDRKQDKYYGTKKAAKAARRHFNGLDKEGKENLNNGFRVTYGPDHRLYKEGQR